MITKNLFTRWQTPSDSLKTPLLGANTESPSPKVLTAPIPPKSVILGHDVNARKVTEEHLNFIQGSHDSASAIAITTSCTMLKNLWKPDNKSRNAMCLAFCALEPNVRAEVVKDPLIRSYLENVLKHVKEENRALVISVIRELTNKALRTPLPVSQAEETRGALTDMDVLPLLVQISPKWLWPAFQTEFAESKTYALEKVRQTMAIVLTSKTQPDLKNAFVAIKNLRTLFCEFGDLDENTFLDELNKVLDTKPQTISDRKKKDCRALIDESFASSSTSQNT